MAHIGKKFKKVSAEVDRNKRYKLDDINVAMNAMANFEVVKAAIEFA